MGERLGPDPGPGVRLLRAGAPALARCAQRGGDARGSVLRSVRLQIQGGFERLGEEGGVEMETKNAIIERATITSDDHGLLSAWLHLDYGGTGQAFGGYALYLPPSFSHHELRSMAGHFLWRCMEVAGVTEWGALPGKTIRVRAEHSRVHAIGHIVKEDWFDPGEDFHQGPLDAHTVSLLKALKNNWNRRAEVMKKAGNPMDYYRAETIKQCAKELHDLLRGQGVSRTQLID